MLGCYTTQLAGVSMSLGLQKCCEAGAKVVATDLNMEKLKELKAEVPAIEIDHLDVTKGEDVQAVIKKHSDINVLFNCAG